MKRTGETNKNTYGSLMTIIEYESSKNIIVEFENGYRVKSRYGDFKKGSIKSPYDKTIFNVGYLGEGEYKVKDKDKKLTTQYSYWSNMLKRCYDERYKIKKPTYKKATVCEEWLNFQNFAKWFDENWYETGEDVICLDKDILNKGNKVYSNETCVFVPDRINKLFVKRDLKRGEDCIGVKKYNNKYRARCCFYDKDKCKYIQKHLGYFTTPEEAFYRYKEFKENYIKEVADEYKEVMPVKLYEAMYNYIVEIDD